LVYFYNTLEELVRSKSDSESESESESEIPAPPTQERKDSIPLENGLGRVGVISIGGLLGLVWWAGARRWRAGRVGKNSKLV